MWFSISACLAKRVQMGGPPRNLQVCWRTPLTSSHHSKESSAPAAMNMVTTMGPSSEPSKCGPGEWPNESSRVSYAC